MRAVLPLLSLLTFPALAAEPLSCPPNIEITPQVTVKPVPGWQLRPTPERHALSAVHLFDGDPADMADLIPDTNTTRGAVIGMVWELRPGMSYSFVCDYEGTAMTMVAKVPADAKQCRAATKSIPGVRPPGNTYLEASCR